MKPFLFCLSAILLSLPAVGAEFPCPYATKSTQQSRPYRFSYQYKGRTVTGTYTPVIFKRPSGMRFKAWRR